MVNFRPNKRQILIGVGVIVLLFGAAVAGVLLRQAKDPVPKDTSSNGTTGIIKGGEPLTDVAEEADRLRFEGDPATAAKVVDEGLANPNAPDDERYQLYIQKGNLLTDEQNYTAGIAAYEQAEKVKQTYEITNLLGEMWITAGNNTKAIDYFKKAISLAPKGPLQDSNKVRLSDRIKSLGGTP